MDDNGSKATKLKVTVFAGDGIGTEVTDQALEVLRVIEKQFGPKFTFQPELAGGGSIDAHGVALTDAALRSAKESDAVLLGAVGGPKWDDPKATVRPEQALLRSARSWAIRQPRAAGGRTCFTPRPQAEVIDGVDLLVVRELTGGIYFGKPSERRAGPGPRGRRHAHLHRGRDGPPHAGAFELARSAGRS